jgi:hypothetical protein
MKGSVKASGTLNGSKKMNTERPTNPKEMALAMDNVTQYKKFFNVTLRLCW